MSAPSERSRTVHVTLADAPTDVLVWLCQQDGRAAVSVAEIARAVAPHDADSPVPSTCGALRLLVDAGYAEAVRADGKTALFRATAAGRRAVAQATG